MSGLVDGKARLFVGTAGRVEILRCRGRRSGRGPAWQSGRGHFVLPLAGAFVWHVGRTAMLCDANQLLFAPAGSESAFSHPHGPELSLVVTPAADIVATLTAERSAWSEAQSLAAAPALQIAARELRHAIHGGADPLSLDERIIELTRMMLGPSATPIAVRSGARTTLERAKAFLHARFAEPLTLADIAAAAGVSPVYLTALFRRVEGTALHQYLLKLRLAAALEALPACNDITGLALDLGFSSHSHFTATFRRQFRITPGAYRRGCQGDSENVEAAPPVLPLRPLCFARGGPVEVESSNYTAM